MMSMKTKESALNDYIIIKTGDEPRLIIAAYDGSVKKEDVSLRKYMKTYVNQKRMIDEFSPEVVFHESYALPLNGDDISNYIYSWNEKFRTYPFNDMLSRITLRSPKEKFWSSEKQKEFIKKIQDLPKGRDIDGIIDNISFSYPIFDDALDFASKSLYEVLQFEILTNANQIFDKTLIFLEVEHLMPGSYFFNKLSEGKYVSFNLEERNLDYNLLIEKNAYQKIKKAGEFFKE